MNKIKEVLEKALEKFDYDYIKKGFEEFEKSYTGNLKNKFEFQHYTEAETKTIKVCNSFEDAEKFKYELEDANSVIYKNLFNKYGEEFIYDIWVGHKDNCMPIDCWDVCFEYGDFIKEMFKH